jgi:hypothetical protein
MQIFFQVIDSHKFQSFSMYKMHPCVRAVDGIKTSRAILYKSSLCSSRIAFTSIELDERNKGSS